MKKRAIKFVGICLLLLSGLNGIAQPGESADPNTGLPLEDTTFDAASPINDYIVPMVLLGAVLGLSLLRKNTNVAR